jgi:two-component system NtrC family sensor kinase
LAAFTLSTVADSSGRVQVVIGVGHTAKKLQSMGVAARQASRVSTMAQMAAGLLAEVDHPVVSIRAQAESLLAQLEDKGVDAGIRAAAKEILAGTQRLAKLTGDLVSYAQSRQGELAEISVNALVEEALSLCESLVMERQVRVRTALAGELPRIEGFGDSLRQVFVNLITNSVQAMPAEGGRLTVRTWDNRDGTIGVSVADDGRGIPADLQARIFEPFFSARPEASEEGDGGRVGLGLSLVRDVVQLHQGSIEVDSEIDEGTVMTITLPTGQPRPETADLAAEMEQTEEREAELIEGLPRSPQG